MMISRRQLAGTETRLLLPLAGILVATIVLEVALKCYALIYPQETVRVRYHSFNVPGGTFRYQGSGVINVPGGKFRYQGSTGVIKEFDVTHQLNYLGFNDENHTISKPRDVIRVLVLGDSYTEAWQVPLGAAYHRVLESLLNERYGGDPRFEVIAFGLSG